MRLRNRVGMVFATAFGTLLLVLALMLSAYAVARAENATISRELLPNLEATRQMGNMLDRLFTDEFILMKDRDLEAASGVVVSDSLAAFNRAYAITREFPSSPAELVLLDSLGRQYQLLVAADEQLRILVRQGKFEQASRMHREKLGPLYMVMRRDAEQLYELNRTRITEMREASLRSIDLAGVLSVALAALGTLLGGYLWRRAAEDIVAPLAELQRSAAAIARGDFVTAAHPRADRTTELAELEADFNRMSERLKAGAASLRDANTSLESQVLARTAELREANTTLMGLVAELKTLDQMKSNFMAVMSHELLTPLNFIVGFGSVLEDEVVGPLTAAQREMVGKMLAGAERLTRLVRNTLEYTQLEAGALEINPRSFDYGELLREFQPELAARLGLRSQRLELVVPPDLPSVWADPDRVRQVLLELVDNAGKFSADDLPVRLTVSAEKGLVTTEVADQGIGMSETMLPELFKPFYQADLTRTRSHGGMGLGLAIAYHLVVRMGGTMVVDSAPAAGTRIRFLLPQLPPTTLASGGSAVDVEAPPAG